MISLVLATLCSAAPSDAARYVMSVGGLPVGVVSFALEGSSYTYRSTQVFRSKTRDLTQRFELVDGALTPEVWWLSKKRPEGCVNVIEERSRDVESVCTFAGGGTIGGKPFHAEYDATGALKTLTVASVTFAASAAVLPDRADPFAEGFAVKGRGSHLRVEPRARGVELASVRGVSAEAPEGSCLDLARTEVAKSTGSTVVLGVVIDQGRAWPHAWVKRPTGEHVDPTVSPAEAKARQYLAFSDHPGQLYLELLAGQRTVVR
jgi:hypothetical protein